MTQRLLFTEFIILYKQLHQQHYERRAVISSSEKNEKMFDSFVQSYEKLYCFEENTFSEAEAVAYLNTLFLKWKSASVTRFAIPYLSHIIGQKALLSYQQYAHQNSIRIIPKVTITNSCFQDRDRKRFFGTEKGYVYCLNSTSLWDPFSAYCPSCCFIDKCKQTLAETMPSLYTKRTKLING